MKIDSFSNPITKNYSNNPANIPISEKMNAQATGYEVGTKNSEDAKNLLNTAEGTLNNVADSLNRMRELAINAKNGILTNDDREIIQDEINSIKNDINDSLKNTEFNTIELFNNFSGNVQTGPNENQGQIMHIENTSLKNLGLENFNVMNKFDVEDIDQAIERINETRTEIGTQTNALDNTIRENNVSRENILASENKMDDDFEKEIMELKKNQIIQMYSIQMQTERMNNDQKNNAGILNILG
ncbi:flagellin [Clostridiaceae bacterium HSG29]|nr:flagellin [Clostridiaceae bacterium HSG29]